MSQVESALLLMLMLLLLPSTGSPAKRPGEQSNAIAAVHPFLMKAPAATASIGAVRFSEFAFSPIGAAVGACAGRVFPAPDVWDHKRTSCSNKPETIKSLQRIHGLAGQSSRARQGFLHALPRRDVIVV